MREDGQSLLREIMSRAEAVRVRSILNSTLWAIAVCSPISWIAAYFMRETDVFNFLIYVGAVPIFLLLFQTLFFSIKEPERLQSEEYQLQQKRIQIEMKRGNVIDSGPIIEQEEPLTIPHKGEE